MYSVQDVAAKLAVSPKTIRALILSHKLEAVKVGRLWRITEDALTAYLDRQTNKPPPAKPREARPTTKTPGFRFF